MPLESPLDEIRDAGPADGATLVRRAKSGDREAFEALVIRDERRVLRVALRLLGRPDLAQDAAQEVFLRLHKYLPRFDDERELGPWLYQMIVNVCHDIRRRGARSAALPLSEVPEPADGDGLSAVEARLDRDQRRKLVAAALQHLPAKERAALVLRDIEGLPTSEVARVLGSTEATVRSQVSTGRVKLKKLVDAMSRGRR